MGNIHLLYQEVERRRKQEDAADRDYDRKENRNLKWLIGVFIGGGAALVIAMILTAIFATGFNGG